MSASLWFECDPVDQPSATNPVEQRTWRALRIRVGSRLASRIWDKQLQRERVSLYVPTFPLARWLVQNWWALLNEPCRWETVPRVVVHAAQLRWLKRHCLRTADSALLLPALSLFHDGWLLRAEWHADAPGAAPHGPGEFIGEGTAALDGDGTSQSLSQFINEILSDVASVANDEVHEVASRWRAIQAADTEERQFCALAGRMGLDPYDPREMTEELASFLVETIADVEAPWVRDLTEVAQPTSIAEQWSWVTRVSRELRLGPSQVDWAEAHPLPEHSPADYGYWLAQQARDATGMGLAPVAALEELARSLVQREFRLVERNNLAHQGILAVVGRSPAGDLIAAGPRPGHPQGARFLAARGLYHALTASRAGQRLVTKAFSWDQKASRAFAAELLAPRAALVARLDTTTPDFETVERLSQEFDASPVVIEKQLVNAGLAPVGE